MNQKFKGPIVVKRRNEDDDKVLFHNTKQKSTTSEPSVQQHERTISSISSAAKIIISMHGNNTAHHPISMGQVISLNGNQNKIPTMTTAPININPATIVQHPIGQNPQLLKPNNVQSKPIAITGISRNQILIGQHPSQSNNINNLQHANPTTVLQLNPKNLIQINPSINGPHITGLQNIGNIKNISKTAPQAIVLQKKVSEIHQLKPGQSLPPGAVQIQTFTPLTNQPKQTVQSSSLPLPPSSKQVQKQLRKQQKKQQKHQQQPPPTSPNNVTEYDSIEPKDRASKSNTKTIEKKINRNKISKDESKTIEDYVRNYIESHNLDVSEICTFKRDGEDKVRRKNSELWTELGSLYPDKTAKTIYQHVNRILVGETNPWTEEEDVVLKNLVNTKGKVWSDIARLMNKSSDRCKARYRQLQAIRVNTGRFSPEEDEELIEKIRIFTKAGPNLKPHEFPDVTISWITIANEMQNKRRDVDYCRRWPIVQSKREKNQVSNAKKFNLSLQKGASKREKEKKKSKSQSVHETILRILRLVKKEGNHKSLDSINFSKVDRELSLSYGQSSRKLKAALTSFENEIKDFKFMDKLTYCHEKYREIVKKESNGDIDDDSDDDSDDEIPARAIGIKRKANSSDDDDDDDDYEVEHDDEDDEKNDSDKDVNSETAPNDNNNYDEEDDHEETANLLTIIKNHEEQEDKHPRKRSKA